MDKQDDMVKIRLHGIHQGDVETLWATKVGTNQYRLENSPFFAYGLSWQDVVEAHPQPDNYLEFTRRIQSSGNRTIRIIFNSSLSDPKPEQTLAALRNMECTYEGMQPKMISLNIPPSVSLEKITDFLKATPGLEWEYADPTYAEVTGDSSGCASDI